MGGGGGGGEKRIDLKSTPKKRGGKKKPRWKPIDGNLWCAVRWLRQREASSTGAAGREAISKRGLAGERAESQGGL
jgi:hypothetical protein